MLKVKHERECDCVVAGFRWHKHGAGESVGSLLLGLYDERRAAARGRAASFSDAKRRELVAFLAPYRENALDRPPLEGVGRRAPTPPASACPARRAAGAGGKDLSWEPLRPELVVEVAYDHMQGDRFRHIAQFRRWRPDKRPRDCTYAQLEVVPPEELAGLFAGR